MPPVPRVSVRKRRRSYLGCRMLTCKVGPQEKFFRVHADLMCKTSRVIRNKIQRKRRKIEGDCPICHEELRPEAEDLTFCDASCGRNFHSSCMTGWIQRATAAATCPLSRHDWVKLSDRALNMTDFSERGFEIYMEWLYCAKIPIEVDDSDECYQDLFEAHVVGMKLQDADFCMATLRAIIEVSVDENDYPGPEVVKQAYDKTDGPCALRSVLVGIYMRQDHGDLEDLWDSLPNEFTCDLSMTLLKEVPAEKKVWTLEALTADLLPQTPANEGSGEV